MIPTAQDLIRLREQLRVERVPVPEWGQDAEVYVRQLLGIDLDTASELWRSGDEAWTETRSHVVLAVLCCCDEEGRQLYSPEDMDALLQAPLEPLRRIARKAIELNPSTFISIESVLGNSNGDPAA